MKKNLMRMQRVLHKICRGQGGATMVITAMFLVALMGFSALVVDLGSVYYASSKLQNALDSAALAAVKELPATSTSSSEWTVAKSEAVALASANHFTLSEDDIAPVYLGGDSSKKIIGIRVTKNAEVPFSFARVLGINSSTISRGATAEVEPAGGITGGAVPLSITDTALQSAINKATQDSGTAAGLLLQIKCCTNTGEIGIDSTGESGWFGALLFPDTNATFEVLLENGYSGSLYVGQILKMNSGNMSGPTIKGTDARIEA